MISGSIGSLYLKPSGVELRYQLEAHEGATPVDCSRVSHEPSPHLLAVAITTWRSLLALSLYFHFGSS
jgi:hypothetical protein